MLIINFLDTPKMKHFYLLLIIYLFTSCAMNTDDNIEKWKKEITDTELSFAKLAKEKGVHHAFMSYADESAVLLREDQLVTGKKEIDDYFNNQTLKEYDLEWSPEFVEVSKSGDLGYTYGHYVFSYTNEEGKTVESTGIFHTVWKRQDDNSWKFVLD